MPFRFPFATSANACSSGIDTTMTVSTMMHGEYGIDDVCLSTLNMVGHDGVRGKVNVSLTDEEVKTLASQRRYLKGCYQAILIYKKGGI